MVIAMEELKLRIENPGSINKKAILASLNGSEISLFREMTFLLNRSFAFDEEALRECVLRTAEFWLSHSPDLKFLENVTSDVRVVIDWLRKAAMAIEVAFGDIPLDYRGVDPHEEIPYDSLQMEKGGVYIVTAVNQRDVYTQILNLHAIVGYLPERHNLLIAREGTEWEEVLLILFRWWRGSGSGREKRKETGENERERVREKKREKGKEKEREKGKEKERENEIGRDGVYFIAHPDLLRTDVQMKLIDFVNGVPFDEQTRPLVLICGASHSTNLLFQLSSRCGNISFFGYVKFFSHFLLIWSHFSEKPHSFSLLPNREGPRCQHSHLTDSSLPPLLF